MKGILLDGNNDLEIKGGTLSLGDTTMQEVGLILGMNKGELKSDPRIGPSLLTLIRSGAQQHYIQQLARQHLKLDNKNFDELKNLIAFNLKT